jgi:sialic acid synthase
MRELTIRGVRIADDTPAYVIAELGHNHGGNIATCLHMVREAAKAGVQAVKLQKRSNRAIYTTAFYDSAYTSPHAYAPTYGAHREALELAVSEMAVVADEAHRLGLAFICTPFDPESVDELAAAGICDAYKIASADLINTPLIEHVLTLGKPVIISTGGGTMVDIRRVTNATAVGDWGRLAFLHCTASYPCPAERMNLQALRNMPPSFVIGLSDHHAGTNLAPIAYALGARIFEKHFTLDQDAKGADNAFSLLPGQMQHMVKALAEAREAMGDGIKRMYPEELGPLAKMAKSVYTTRPLTAGTVLTAKDVALKSPAVIGAMRPYELHAAYGRTLLCDLPAEAPIVEVALG